MSDEADKDATMEKENGNGEDKGKGKGKKGKKPAKEKAAPREGERKSARSRGEKAEPVKDEAPKKATKRARDEDGEEEKPKAKKAKAEKKPKKAKEEKDDGKFVLTLYAYFHCPFCVRVKAILGLKKIPFKTVYLLHHDEKAHIDKIGKKNVPILETEPGKFIGESLDIVRYIDGLSEHGEPLLKPVPADRKEATDAFSDFGVPRELFYPRLVKQKKTLPEFEVKEAEEYFTNKKSKDLPYSFDEAFAKSADLIKDFQPKFDALAKHITGPTGVHGKFLTEDDIILFPKLFTLTVIKGLKWPPAAKKYYDAIAKRSKVTKFAQAL